MLFKNCINSSKRFKQKNDVRCSQSYENKHVYHMPTDNSNTLRVVSSTLATLFQTVVIAKGQYQPQVVRMPPAKKGVESGCNNII